MTFKEFCNLKANEPNENIFPKGTEYSEAMDVLTDTILGKGWYIDYPCSYSQANTEIVGSILYRWEKVNKDKNFYKDLSLSLFLSMLVILVILEVIV